MVTKTYLPFNQCDTSDSSDNSDNCDSCDSSDSSDSSESSDSSDISDNTDQKTFFSNKKNLFSKKISIFYFTKKNFTKKIKLKL